MYVFAIIESLKVFISYLLLVVLLPALILHHPFKNEPLSKRLMIYLVFGNVYLSTIVFILAHLKIFNSFSLITSLFLISFILILFFNRANLIKKTEKIKKLMKEILLGEYGLSLFLKRMIKKIGKEIQRLYHELFDGNKLEWILFLTIMAYNIYQYSLNSFDYMTYIAPDEEVHLYWIQSLVGGDIYPDGVYPHVFHTILAALIKLFNFDGMVMIIYFVSTSVFLIMSSLYLGLREIFKSKYAALLGFMLYSIADIFLEDVTHRFQFTIPQEYGMIFLIPMMIFMVAYIKDKKGSDLVFFGLALSLTIGSHFYTGIIAVILAISIGIVYFYQLIKKKVIFKLILTGILSGLLALAPLAVGLIAGHGLEQSFSWGAEVIKGDIYSTRSDGVLKEDLDLGLSTDKKGMEEDEHLSLDQFQKGAKLDIEKYLFPEIKILYLFLIVLFSSIFFNLLSFLQKKDNQESEYQLAIAVATLFLFLLALILFKALNLPTIMEPKRLAIYLAYFSAVFLGMPLELLSRLFTRMKVEKYFPVFALGTIVSALLLTIGAERVRPLAPIYYFQPTGTTLANWQIMSDYEDLTWTAISPVNNITSVKNRGFHYELSEFILQQEDWNQEKELKIPSEYVFLYIEKRPIVKEGFYFHRGDFELKNRPKITEEDALKNLSDSTEENYHYKKEREILMAKAYAWAQEFQEYFPKETKIYYEDNELIVYQIKQNMYALNNFSIDYKINSR